MTKDEIRNESVIGYVHDDNGTRYTIYDFDRIWDLIHNKDVEPESIRHNVIWDEHCGEDIVTIGYNRVENKDYEGD